MNLEFTEGDVNSGPKNGNFREEGLHVKFLSSDPKKAHPCVEPRRLTYCVWKIGLVASAVGVGRTQTESSRVNIFDVQFRAYVEK